MRLYVLEQREVSDEEDRGCVITQKEIVKMAFLRYIKDVSG